MADADANDFELAGYSFTATPEETRPPRIVRVAAIQNKIVLPTTAPITKQVGNNESIYTLKIMILLG